MRKAPCDTGEWWQACRVISYVALLRAVNVGGTGKLPMAELRAMCESAGFSSVKTYIASGNVVFRSKLPAAKVKALLEEALLKYAGKPVGVLLRTAAELKSVMEGIGNWGQCANLDSTHRVRWRRF